MVSPQTFQLVLCHRSRLLPLHKCFIVSRDRVTLQIFCMFVMTIGTVIYSILFGSMTALITSMNLSESRCAPVTVEGARVLLLVLSSIGTYCSQIP